MKFFSKLQTLIKRRRDLPLLCMAYARLGLATLSIQRRPFTHIAERLGVAQHITPVAPLLAAQKWPARRIAWCIRTAAKYTPWTSNCFPQALVAQRLLCKAGIPCTVYFGVQPKVMNDLDVAHAWVRAGKFYVVGGDGHAYVTVATFATNNDPNEQ